MNEHIKPQDGIVFDLRLGAHSGINYSAEDFSLFLKLNALFCRSLVVTNTDLNNNSSFHEPSVFKELSRAIKIGFIRRATRVESNGCVWTQQQTLNQLHQNNEQRAAKIPRDYVDRLDRQLKAAEQSYQPLTWSAEEISNIFADRLVHRLSVSRQEPRSGEAKELTVTLLLEYIRQCQSNGITVSAAEIEKSFFKDVHEDPEAMSLWEEVKICYNGNVEKAFDRKVITAMTQEMAENRYLPSYNNLDSLSKGKIIPASNVEEIIPVKLNIADKNFNWLLDISKVSRLSLDDIIQLREKADPEPYFDARHTLLLSGNTHELGSKRNEYWDRLANAGIAVQDQKKRELSRSLMESEAEAEWQSTVIGFAENLLGNIPGVGMLLLAREPFRLARSWKRLNSLKHGKIEDSDEAKLLSLYELYQQIPDFEIMRRL